MTTPITLHVTGVATPKGSKTGFVKNGRAVLVEGKSKSGREKASQWKHAVRDAAAEAAEIHGQMDEPVSVSVFVRFALPKSDPYRTLHTTKPDGDKLAREILDCLTASGLLRDDALVCSLVVDKSYARPDETPGAQIAIYPRGAEEARNRQHLKDIAAAERRAKKGAA